MNFQCEYGVGNKYQPQLMVCKKVDPCEHKMPYKSNVVYCRVALNQSIQKGELEKKLSQTNSKGKENGKV